jgi:uncharacterized SAM-binding protein YcdF (DUF218 family)
MPWLKSVLGALLMPLPIGLGVLLAAVVLLFRRPDSRAGRWLVLLGTAWLLAASVGGPWRWLAACLEDRSLRVVAARPEEGAPRFVVVLGAGHRDRPELPLTSQLSEPATVRLVEGVRLWRTLPDARLVVTGTVDPGRIREPEAMAALAVQLGVPADRVVQETASLDTDDHARYLQAILGREPFLLVTSALHLPRAVLLFESAGMHPIPAPCGALSSPGERDWMPAARALERSTRTAHEAIGLLWAHLVRALDAHGR